jgi:hypothetical protein
MNLSYLLTSLCELHSIPWRLSRMIVNDGGIPERLKTFCLRIRAMSIHL